MSAQPSSFQDTAVALPHQVQSSDAPTTPPIAVHKLSLVFVFCPVSRAAGSPVKKVGEIHAHKFLLVSKKFEDFLRVQPPVEGPTIYNFVIEGLAAMDSLVKQFMTWLLSFKMPFPDHYKGKKNIQ